MFFLGHIWKQARIWPFIALILTSLLIIPAPAHATGEYYTWKSSTDTSSFTGHAGGNGSYTKDVTFTRSSTSGGSATYTGTGTYTCFDDNKPHTDHLTVTFDPTAYNNGQPHEPTLGTLSGTDACFADTFIDPSISVVYPNTDPVTGASTTSETACDQGSLSWLFCPVIDNISKGVSKLATSVLTPLLQVSVISPSSTPQLYEVWTHLRDLADVLFILVFFAIIASTILEQDIAGINPYTIKHVWVRLILAAIFVQFSFLICGFIVDIGNVLGFGITSLLGFLTNPSMGPPSLSNYIGNLMVGTTAAIAIIGAAFLISWEIILPILATLLITLFVAFLTLGARYLIIAILIAASPLACVAFVLPNTRHFFDDWFKLLFRLVLMFPIIIGVFSLAGIVNEILPFSATTAPNVAAKLAVAFLKPLITVAAFLIIPASFKLAGKGLERAYGFLNGTGSKGKSFIKNSEMYKTGQAKRKERQASLMHSLSTNPDVTAFTQSSSRFKRAAGRGFLTASGLALAGASSSPKGIQVAYNKAQSERAKVLKEFENISPGLLGDAVLAAYGDRDKLDKIRREAPGLVEYTKTLAGRSALVGRAMEMGIFTDEHERKILGSRLRGEFPTLQTSIGKHDYPKKPHLQRVDKDGIARDDFGVTVKGYTSKFIADTVDKGAIFAAAGREEKDPNGKLYYIPDARSISFAKGWRELEPGQVGSLYAPGRDGRNRVGQDKRSAFLQMVGNNVALWKQTDKGLATLEELRNAIADDRSADLYKDFYINILNKDKDWVEATFKPETDAGDRATMRREILDHLK